MLRSASGSRRTELWVYSTSRTMTFRKNRNRSQRFPFFARRSYIFGHERDFEDGLEECGAPVYMTRMDKRDGIETATGSSAVNTPV